jgi:hypothetical protein
MPLILKKSYGRGVPKAHQSIFISLLSKSSSSTLDFHVNQIVDLVFLLFLHSQISPLFLSRFGVAASFGHTLELFSLACSHSQILPQDNHMEFKEIGFKSGVNHPTMM